MRLLVGGREINRCWRDQQRRLELPFRSPSCPLNHACASFSFHVICRHQGNIHVLSMSTEHDHSPTSPQWAWIKADLEAVNRTRTPWLLVTSHRPMYGSDEFEYTAHIPGSSLQQDIEPLLVGTRGGLHGAAARLRLG